jgi:hypothetical protein
VHGPEKQFFPCECDRVAWLTLTARGDAKVTRQRHRTVVFASFWQICKLLIPRQCSDLAEGKISQRGARLANYAISDAFKRKGIEKNKNICRTF